MRNYFFEARKLVKDKKLSAAWTDNGVVHVKRTADANDKAVMIKSRDDLNIY